MPFTTSLAARSKLLSAKTIWGDLPPSSRTTGFTCSADARIMARPVSTDPVKVIEPILYHRKRLVRRTIIAHHDSDVSVSLAEHASWRFSDVTCVIVVRHQRWDQRNVFQRWEL